MIMADSPATPGREPMYTWDGVLDSRVLTDVVLEERHRLADAARDYDWPTVVSLLQGSPWNVNVSRPGGTSGFAPLHQAAHGGAPMDVVDELIGLGAWRTLRTTGGERPVDVARRRGHTGLLGRLEPVLRRNVPGDRLAAMKGRFHDVIRGRVRVIRPLPALRLPELEPLLELGPDQSIWFPVPGMYGGFSYALEGDGEGARLVVSSWCRVVDGSGERHVITAERTELVEVGFV